MKTSHAILLGIGAAFLLSSSKKTKKKPAVPAVSESEANRSLAEFDVPTPADPDADEVSPDDLILSEAEKERRQDAMDAAIDDFFSEGGNVELSKEIAIDTYTKLGGSDQDFIRQINAWTVEDFEMTTI